MRNVRGFTLIETLITTAVLVSGLVAVASMFSYSAGANLNSGQRTVAMFLLYEKMEQFKSAPLSQNIWVPGGSLDPASPTPGYFDYVTVTSTPYMRLWQITGTMPRRLTTIVYAEKAGLTRQRMELIRATTMVSSTF